MGNEVIRLAGIAGSLRRASYSRMVLETLAEQLPLTVSLIPHPLDEVPLYNGDLDTATPPPGVHALRQAIGGSDGIVVVTPEYNHGIPGVLKNALDWASRPGFASVLVDKPALMVSVSPGAVGGARAQTQLRETLAGAAARVIARRQIAIGNIDQKISGERLVDRTTIDFALQGIQDLLMEIRRERAFRALA